jgi:tetratricopeptide (TPR) repeat protein
MPAPTAQRPPELDRLKAMCQSGYYAPAIGPLAALAVRYPRHPEVLYLLGVAESRLDRFRDAERTLKKAMRLVPKVHQLHYELGFCFRRQGRLDDARKCFQKAAELSNRDPAVIGAMADLEVLAGDYDGALALIEPLLDTADRNVLSVYAPICAKLKRHDEAIERIERALAEANLKPADRLALLFRVGWLHDAVGDYDTAFDRYREANQLHQRPFDAQAHDQVIEMLINRWTPEAIAAAPVAHAQSRSPIFIVGMPRTGTSLLEQALDMHPDVHGAGERAELAEIASKIAAPLPLVDPARLDQQALDRGAAEYLTAMSRVAGRVKRITDKAPFNFSHLGLVQLMLPGASVLNCRRNPIDTCLSIYFQHFTAGPIGGGTFAGIAAIYRAYLRLMHHWHDVLELPILDVQYEEVVADTETQLRKVVDHVGLEWNDDVLRFHKSSRPTLTASVEQVRRPVYNSSVERWRRYERHIAPLIDALGDLAQT